MKTSFEINSSEIINRMKKICDVVLDKDLATKVELKPNSISNWRKINSIPFEALIKISVLFDVSLDWLVFGEERQEALSTHEKMALLAFNDLDDRQKMRAIILMGGLNSDDGDKPAAVQSVVNNSGTVVGRDMNVTVNQD